MTDWEDLAHVQLRHAQQNTSRMGFCINRLLFVGAPTYIYFVIAICSLHPGP